MSAAVSKVLIIGGGFSGMSAAIELRKRDIETHLVEINTNWGADGAGISLGGATLRAFITLGILENFLEKGSAHDGLDLMTPNGHHIERITTDRVAGPDIPSEGAIMRPVLAKIMADVALAAGAQVRLGCSFKEMVQDQAGVDVELDDGSRDRFDLVIGADGLYSKTREWLFPDAPKPKYSGQGVWRAVLPKPSEVTNTMMFVGPNLKVGLNPVSQDEMYLFLTEDRSERLHIPQDQQPQMLKELLDTFSAPLLQRVREQLDNNSQVLYRPLEGLLIPQPWYHNRVVLIGDAVHATTPHLASGACIGIEDSIVLVEELNQHDQLSMDLEAFQLRRWDRCRMVVENSGRLGQIEIEGGDKEEHTRIMRDSLIALSQPI